MRQEEKEKMLRRKQLFYQYVNELNKLEELPPVSFHESSVRFSEYLENDATLWIDIVVSGKIIGFLVIGYPPNCHPDADYYLEEAYIEPAFRNMGIMTNSFRNFLKEHPGTYCLFVLNKNLKALKFWKNLFSAEKYCMCDLEDVGAGDEHCTQYGFSKQRFD